MENLKENLKEELRTLYDNNTKTILNLVDELKEDTCFDAGNILETAEMIVHFKNLNEVYNNILNKLT